MHTVDEIATAVRALLRPLSPSDRRAVRDEVWPRQKPGPKKLRSDAAIVRGTMTVLEETMPLSDEWLMDLPLKQLEAIKRSPSPRQSTVLIELPTKKGRLTRVKIPLSLDAWKKTTQGLVVFRREGQEKFEAWALRETEKVIQWKRRGRAELLNIVERHIGDTPRKNRRYAKGGRFAQGVQIGLDTFLAQRRIRWNQIPPGLRDKGTLWQPWRLQALIEKSQRNKDTNN